MPGKKRKQRGPAHPSKGKKTSMMAEVEAAQARSEAAQQEPFRGSVQRPGAHEITAMEEHVSPADAGVLQDAGGIAQRADALEPSVAEQPSNTDEGLAHNAQSTAPVHPGADLRARYGVEELLALQTGGASSNGDHALMAVAAQAPQPSHVPELNASAGNDCYLNDEEVRIEFDDEILALCLICILLAVALGQLDGRSIRGPITENVVVRTDFFPTLKAQRSRTAYKKTLRCSPASFDALVIVLEPLYVKKYGYPAQNTQYPFDMGLAALLTYYGNGTGIDGDGIGGAASQLGMSRTVAGIYIKRLEDLPNDMMPDVIYFPAPSATEEWEALVEGFAQRGSDFPDVACVFDGTIIKTRRPQNHMGFYDKNGNPSYNCLAAIDYRGKFRYLGVFSGSNSDQGMWNQSQLLGPRARYVCPPGINWLADAGFKIWPFLMVPFDERRGKRLSRKQRCFNYHISSTRILVECVFGKIKGRFKVLRGVTDRHEHTTNARMICAAAVLHNLLVDIGDKEVFEWNQEEETRKKTRQAMNAFAPYWDRTQDEINLGEAKRNAYMERFYRSDNE